MRPRLSDKMGAIPITARVAIQLTVIQARKLDYQRLPPALLARVAARELPLDYPGFLRFALHSLAVYLDLGYRASVWLDCVLDASHYGSSFRRCFFFDYKDNRSPYPRVTNRGVQASPKGRKSALRKS